MDRLQKKCLIASTGAHVSLALVFLFGSAFVSSKSKTDNMPVLDVIPSRTIDALAYNPGAATPPAPRLEQTAQRPETPAPQHNETPPPPVDPPSPKPPPAREVEPPVRPKDPESIEPERDRKSRKVDISTNLVVHRPDRKAEAKARAEAQAREQAQAMEARRRLADKIGRTADRVGSSISESTTIKLDQTGDGIGGGTGPAYANFLQDVKSRYANDWVVPDGVTDDTATAVASVTIARDGTVLSARIIRPSGSAGVDWSVQATLDRVRFAAPLPEDAKEDRRTVTINFNVRAKRGLG